MDLLCQPLTTDKYGLTDRTTPVTALRFNLDLRSKEMGWDQHLTLPQEEHF
jgi:hypothetical protein